MAGQPKFHMNELGQRYLLNFFSLSKLFKMIQFLQLSVVEQTEARRLMSTLHEMVKALNERNEKRDEAAAKSE